jgi:hypothetical protein
MFQVGKLYKTKSPHGIIIMILKIITKDEDRTGKEFTTVKALFDNSDIKTFSIYSEYWEEVDP